jgi:hypothetical protein
MCVHRDETRAMADITKNVAHRVDDHFVEADLFHLFFNAMDNAFFITAFARYCHHVP